jgi:tetratricopeptide (TPR) repeat protein
VLDQADGLALLGELTRGRSVEPEAARSVVELSGGLPLAIRVAAGRLASRPDLPAATYVERLASRRLDELELGDLAVRACIRTSYDALLTDGTDVDRLAARAFRTLGLLHVPNVTPWVVAAMLAEPEPEAARAALDRLVEAQLVEPVADGRYQLHDLVRLLAAERAESEDPPPDRREAVSRAIAYYTGALWRAVTIIRPGRALVFGDPPLPGNLPLPMLSQSSESRAWTDAELTNLVAALKQASTMEGAGERLVLWFGIELWHSLDARCEWQEAHRLTRLMRDSGEASDDPELTACGYLLLGRSEATLGNYDEASRCFGRVVSLFGDLGNPTGIALALNGLGIVCARQQDLQAALSYYTDALDIANAHQVADLAGTVLNNMSVSYSILGQLDQAAAALDQSLVIGTDGNDLVTCATAMINLAAVNCLRGNQAEAIRCADEGLLLSREAGDRMRECETLLIRSEAYLKVGRIVEAEAEVESALALARTSSYRSAVAAALRQRSKVLAAGGHKVKAAHARSQAGEAYAQLADAFRDQMIELLVCADRPTRPWPGAGETIESSARPDTMTR